MTERDKYLYYIGGSYGFGEQWGRYAVLTEEQADAYTQRDDVYIVEARSLSSIPLRDLHSLSFVDVFEAAMTELRSKTND